MILNLMCGLLQLVACLCTLFQAIKATKDLLLLRVVMQRPLSKQKVNAEESGSVIFADKLVYEDALRTGFELTSLCTSSGSGRPDLQEDDSPELSRVKDHFQTVDKFHSGIGNDGNSFLKTNDYARGDIGLSSGLHFCFCQRRRKKLKSAEDSDTSFFTLMEIETHPFCSHLT
jgi:hypothetical protein